MLLISLLALAGLTVAAPVPTDINLATTNDDNWNAWVCSDDDFRGICVRVYANNACARLPDQVYGKMSSIMQWTPYICDYYAEDNCGGEGFRVDFRDELTNGASVKWLINLGKFSDKAKSAYCTVWEHPPEARSPAVAEGDQAHAHGILAYRKPNLVDLIGRWEANEGCSPNCAPGSLQSVIQELNLTCFYYQTQNCAASNHVASLCHSTRDETYKWSEMQQWTGKILSLECTSTTTSPDPAAPRAPSPDLAPAIISVFTQPSFGGTQTTVDAAGKCSPNFDYGSIASLRQPQGTVCTYFQSWGCAPTNHVPSLRHDSSTAAWEAADLEEWKGKIMSFRCD